jgi:hypothetical protein
MHFLLLLEKAMPTGLRTWIDFRAGATITENYLGEVKPPALLSSKIDTKDLENLIRVLDRLKIQVFPEYGDSVVFDIPYQSLWSFMGHPLLIGNTLKNTDDAWGLHQISRALVRDDGFVPHSYQVVATAWKGNSEASLMAFFSEERHHIDVSRFEHRAKVIAATTYIDAMLQYMLRKTHTRGKIDLNDKIKLCQENGILNKDVCSILHSLRNLRNNSAHEFSRDWKVRGTRFKLVSVPQSSQQFMKSLKDFVSKAEARYGKSTDPMPKFIRCVELVAGELNKKAKLDSVIMLGAIHSDELDKYFN